MVYLPSKEPNRSRWIYIRTHLEYFKSLLINYSKSSKRDIKMFTEYMGTDKSYAKIAKENFITTERVRQIVYKQEMRCRIIERK